MNDQYCCGLDAATGQPLEIRHSRTIDAVEPLIGTYALDTYLAPGFVDIQVNGFAGVDYCAPGASPEEIGRSIRVLFSTGVTRVFPTVITGSRECMAGAIANLARAKRELGIEGEAMEGFHIEGPHISAEDGPRGAHPVEAVRAPDTAEFDRWMDLAGGNIKLVTVAPEWPAMPAYIEHAVSRGVVVAIGHTKASAAEIDDAVRAGATMSTHLGNGAHQVLQRHPNYIWDQLADDRLAASFIADGIHLPASFLKPAIRAKGIERSIMTTDAVMPAGCAPGRYRLGEVDVELHADDRVTLVGKDKLAGSSLRMDRGVENLMRLAGVSLLEALTMSSRNPARAGRVWGRQRGLVPGERADLIEFQFDAATKSITIVRTWVSGELVFERG